MITALRIQNFKALADTQKLPIRPLTFLVGPNSAGKTSIIQSLLLLRQTVESRDLKNPLGINGPYVQLGSYPDLLFMHNLKKKLNIEIEFSSRYQVALRGLPTPDKFISFFTDRTSFEVEFGYNKKTMQVYLEKCRFLLFPSGSECVISRQTSGKYQARIRIVDQTADHERFLYAVGVEKFYAIRGFDFKKKLTPTNVFLRNTLSLFSNRLAREIEESFSSVFYIGPLREWPKRIYIATGEAPQDVGLKGELSVDVLWTQARTKATREKLLGKVNHWMQEFGIGSKVSLKRIGGNNYSVVFEDPKNMLPVNMADVGFGASQVFPIVVEGFYARDKAMLLIEQPEIHLHPRAQATLGDLLIDIARSGAGKTVLVETHSEHVLARIRRRIAERTLKKEEVAIYYCQPSAEGTRVNQVEITDQGQYEGTGLPPGFFEESFEEAIEQFKAIASKQAS